MRIAAGALIGYGIGGALLSLALAVAIAPSLPGVDAFARSSADVSNTLSAARVAFGGFGESLSGAQRSAERAATAARSSAGSARQLADAMSIRVLGAQPLLPLATSFAHQAQDLDALAVELDLLATTLATNRGDVSEIGVELGILSDRAASIAASPPATAAAGPLVVGLAIWLAGQGLAMAGLGLWLWRQATRARV